MFVMCCVYDWKWKKRKIDQPKWRSQYGHNTLGKKKQAIGRPPYNVFGWKKKKKMKDHHHHKTSNEEKKTMMMMMIV